VEGSTLGLGLRTAGGEPAADKPRRTLIAFASLRQQAFLGTAKVRVCLTRKHAQQLRNQERAERLLKCPEAIRAQGDIPNHARQRRVQMLGLDSSDGAAESPLRVISRLVSRKLPSAMAAIGADDASSSGSGEGVEPIPLQACDGVSSCGPGSGLTPSKLLLIAPPPQATRSSSTAPQLGVSWTITATGASVCGLRARALTALTSLRLAR